MGDGVGEASFDWTPHVPALLDRDQDIAEAVERWQRTAGHAAARTPVVAQPVAANRQNLAWLAESRGEAAPGAVPARRQCQRQSVLGIAIRDPARLRIEPVDGTRVLLDLGERGGGG
jgi:hypothetical protein